MNPERLVLVQTGNPTGFGSGYLVGPQLVLTALHVVLAEGRWAEHVQARVGHPHFGRVEQRRAQVCWPDPEQGVPAADGLDIALIWLDEPVATTGGPVVWGLPEGTGQIPYTGAGFPAFAADAGSSAQVEALRGELSAVSTSSAGWVLDCRIWPAASRDGERPWAGASGAAVFCHGRLVGVAVEDNRSMDWRRLHAAPIHKALDSPGFAELVTRKGHAGTAGVPETVTATGDAAPPGATEPRWPVVVGQVPTLATALQPRSDLREEIERARAAGGSVVLTQVLSGGGGVGKTQLAAACVTDALAQGTDIVVWAPAAEPQQVITQYARAAADLHLAGATGEDPEADARTLLAWLGTTSRRWLVVLDDVTDPVTLGAWWPVSRSGTGWSLATTRLNDARLTGGGRTRVDIGIYTPEESISYLSERLDRDDMGHLLDDQATSLAEALGHLPLALGLAAAHMLNEALTCTEYLDLFNSRATRLADALPDTADAEGYGRHITVALLLAFDAVQEADTTNLAGPALCLAALLDPAGHPHSFWSSPPLLEYFSHYPPYDQQVTAGQIHSVLRLLHRYALITHDRRAEPRAVRIHALTARAVRESIPAVGLAHLATAAADGLLHIWPEIDPQHPELAATLRTNTDALALHTDHQLWHPVLHRAGDSLSAVGLISSATAYWQRMVTTDEGILGADHPHLLSSRASLAICYRQGGRTDEAIELLEHVVADSERLLGGDHPDTLLSRNSLASAYLQRARTEDATALLERLVADSERLLGPDHRTSLLARANLAGAYQQGNQADKALGLQEQAVADSERLHGTLHPSTLTARNNLARLYQKAGRAEEALALQEQVLSDSERLLGTDHPNTLLARANLADSYRQGGRIEEAIVLLEQVVPDRERVLGPDHLDTVIARGSLAGVYEQAGRTEESIDLLESVVADCERLLGVDHPDIILVRYGLAGSYQRVGRTDEALGHLWRVAFDSQRLLGPDHPTTLAARDDLGYFYERAGLLPDSIESRERMAADVERLLGAAHPDTFLVRNNLATFYEQTASFPKAIAERERVVTDTERHLGPDHTYILIARTYLADSYRQSGQTHKALDLMERVAADSTRMLGPDHPNTLVTLDHIARLRQSAIDPGPEAE
ncbi:tetratricopeptide repeat protein [Streptomyces sp. SS]|uniref:tetratricopeptide repeat protein n=1 Tax=Streptomyces sp. SS TaxID=260742 RepID=UPI000FFC21BF|nr:tetratricopeptide repeat protein [Streptomyces sp. SS]